MRVLIADDHPLYREAAALQVRRLYRDADVTEVASLAELRHAAQPPGLFDLILIDFYMPGMSPAALQDFVQDHPGVPLAMVSGSADNAEVRAAIRAGVRGYIPKTSSSDYFGLALQLLLSGGTSIPVEVLLDDMRAPASRWQDSLSARERDVLKGIVQGLPNKEIARELGLAEVTVKLHLRNIYRKMDVRSRAEAAVKAFRAGVA